MANRHMQRMIASSGQYRRVKESFGVIVTLHTHTWCGVPSESAKETSPKEACALPSSRRSRPLYHRTNRHNLRYMTLEGARYQRGENVEFAQFPVVPTMAKKISDAVCSVTVCTCLVLR